MIPTFHGFKPTKVALQGLEIQRLYHKAIVVTDPCDCSSGICWQTFLFRPLCEGMVIKHRASLGMPGQAINF